jgi:hypothetical protein
VAALRFIVSVALVLAVVSTVVIIGRRRVHRRYFAHALLQRCSAKTAGEDCIHQSSETRRVIARSVELSVGKKMKRERRMKE